MDSHAIAKKALEGLESSLSSDEIRFLAAEHLRLLRQAKPDEPDIKLPQTREELENAFSEETGA